VRAIFPCPAGTPHLERTIDMRIFSAALTVAAIALVAFQARTEDTLEKVKKAGVLKWGADPSGGAPYVFNDPKDNDKVIGFEMDIMDKLAGHLGLKHELVKGTWDSLVDNLKSKRADVVMNGLEITEMRQKEVSFSDPYYVYEQQLTVRVGDKDKYNSLDDLKGHKVGTLNAAESNNVLKRAGFTEEQILVHDDSQTPYENLGLKRVDAVLQESIIAAYYAGKNPKLFNLPKTFSPGKYGIAARKEDGTLLVEINKGLKTMRENGELAAIYKKWNIWTDAQKTVGIEEK
jgi:polar amino acid transport system substrate-binding protein